MGFRESLITDWDGKTIRFHGRIIYILKQFEYDNKTYFYGVDRERSKNNHMEVIFLYKIKDDLFGCVETKEECDKLLIHVGAIFTGELIYEAQKQDEKERKQKNEENLLDEK